MDRSDYRRDIDGLRMVAVMPVVLEHAGLPLFPGGFTGVDVFFVISGYLITSILAREIENGDFSILRFYERRARRILPALFVVLGVCLVVGWFLLSPQRYESLGKSVVATLAFLSNIWFWRDAGNYFSPAVEFEPLLHTWSLAVEEQFYLVFPLLLAAIASLSRRSWILIVAVIALLSLALSIVMTTRAPSANFYLVPTRAWELGAGALLALGAFPQSKKHAFHELSGWLGLFLILCSIFLITDETPFPGVAALPSVLGAVLIIYAGTGHSTQVGRLLSLRPFVWIGLISYSLYLWHWPILVAAREITKSEHLGPVAIAVCLCLSLGAAWLSWRFVEKPFRASSGERAFSGNQIFIMSGAGIAALALCAAIVVGKEGYLGQFPAERVAIYKEFIQRDPIDRACMNTAGHKPCELGADGSEPSIALWGDSHAGALAPGFDAWLRKQGEGGLAYTKSACAPLLGVYRADQPPSHACDAHNAAVVADLLQRQKIDTVLLYGRWALASTGLRTKRELGRSAPLAATGTTVNDTSKNPELFSEGIDQSVQRLREAGKNVVIIRGTPEIGLMSSDLVLRYGDNIPADLVPTLDEVKERNKLANAVLDTLAQAEKVTVLDGYGHFCTQTCKLQIDGHPLIRDDDHLSSFGARWFFAEVMADWAAQTGSVTDRAGSLH